MENYLTEISAVWAYNPQLYLWHAKLLPHSGKKSSLLPEQTVSFLFFSRPMLPDGDQEL
jgi:hypothetical protein